MKKIGLYVIGYLWIVSVLVAQDEQSILDRYSNFGPQNAREYAALKVGKKIYFTGDQIDFSCLLLNQYFLPDEVYSKVLHLSLVDEDDQNLDFVFRAENGYVQDRIQIPHDLPTGNYQLVAHTRFMQNDDWEYQNHRVPIYIQNVTEKPQPVIKAIAYPSEEQAFSNDSSFKITEYDSYLEVQIDHEKGDYYLVSEGFSNIQFLAKVKVKSKPLVFSVPKENLKGQFQRFVLVDENLNVRTCHNYFLKSESKGPNLIVNAPASSDEQKQLQISHDAEFFGALNVGKQQSQIAADPQALFKRIFQLFYRVPKSVNLDELDFETLTSNEFLSAVAYSPAMELWSDILKERSSVYPYTPEQEIIVSGNVDFTSDDFRNKQIRLHIFKNDINIVKSISQTGRFSIDVPFFVSPEGTGMAYAALYDKDGNRLKEGVKFDFDQYPVRFIQPDTFYDSDKTNSIISESQKLKYILSTYREDDVSEDEFFWSSKQLDDVFEVADYQSIETTEEFIREVLTKTTVKKEGVQRSIMMYSRDNRTIFKNPPLTIVDNKILDDPGDIFDIPLTSIKSFGQAYHDETMESFGNAFRDGIFIISTLTGSEETRDYNQKSYFQFNGYHVSNVTSNLTQSFDDVLLMQTVSGDVQVGVQKSKEQGTYNIQLESFSFDGHYQHQVQTMEIK